MTRFGAVVADGGTRFTVRSSVADAVLLCLFATDGSERRLPMEREGDRFTCLVDGVGDGQRYGFRADGRWAPDADRWCDPAKLLVDPFATELDRPFVADPQLAQFGADTAALVPRAIVRDHPVVPQALPFFAPSGLIYELNVRGFTMRHPDVPPAQRGTVAALAHPVVIAHLRRIGVGAVELMPIVAAIDERHLPPLGLRNAWGYNPVVPMALDPSRCPGGVAELRDTVAALHDAGIGVLLDLVFNHSGESDRHGPVLSLRALDPAAYARDTAGVLINDTGTGNTLDFGNADVRELCLATLRHFVRHCGIDGFRFDLAPVLARSPGFDPDAPIFAEIAADPWLRDRVMIAEPWDIGPGGYQLGSFPGDWLEWNDRYRDEVRHFWRGDGAAGALATRMMGSSDLFGAETRSVSFVAAHDGFTLADVVAFDTRHNHANGEDNRDGHADEVSWNNGAEGPTADPAVDARRSAAVRALLATLFATRGTIQLTAGDEFGRSQGGNNNAYAQDNAVTWLDWRDRDEDLVAFVEELAAFRARHAAVFDPARTPHVAWHGLDGTPMSPAAWEAPDCMGFVLRLDDALVRVDRIAGRVTLSHADAG